MSHTDQVAPAVELDELPADVARRRLLGWMSLAGAALAASGSALASHAAPAMAQAAAKAGRASAGAGPALPTGAEFVEAQKAVFRDSPSLLASIRRGGDFGSGDFSMAIANHMYSRTDAKAIADARAMLRVEPQGPRQWTLRLPFVNVTVFETDAGLVLVDSGYAPAGPALRDELAKLSDKPVHTVIFSHHHADHCLGAWALLEGGHRPEIVATDRFVTEMELDFLTHGLVARQNQQAVFPTDWSGVVRPTRTFHTKLTLNIGGEDFVLTEANGETAGQLWVAVPGRRVVCSADYFQGGFLPNTGNGKRRQRYPITWARALREMAALKPTRVLTGHGDVLDDEAQIQRRLPAQAAMLESITAQVVAGLNSGQRRDLILDQVKLPDELAKLDDAREYYDKPRDIAAMAVKQLSGWWDDVPSQYAPAPLAAQAREIAALAGGPGKLIARALQLSRSDVALACNLADWAWLAAPADKTVLQGATAVYRARVAQLLPTQDALVYAEHLVNLQLQTNRGARA